MYILDKNNDDGPVVILDKPGATLKGATVRGARVQVNVDGATVSGVRVERLPVSFDALVPAAFALGAVLTYVLTRWGK